MREGMVLLLLQVSVYKLTRNMIRISSNITHRQMKIINTDLYKCNSAIVQQCNHIHLTCVIYFLSNFLELRLGTALLLLLGVDS